MTNAKLIPMAAVAMAISVAFGEFVVSDEPGQTIEWTDPGQRGGLPARDFMSDSYWQGGSAPMLTNASAMNLTVRLTGMPTEARRLQELKEGVDPSVTRYYGLVSLYHEFSDASNWTLYLDGLEGGLWSNWDLWWTSWGFPLVIRDPSKYLGWFDVRDRDRGAYSYLYLQSNASFTSTVNRACVSGSLGFKVPTGAHAVVKEVFGAGLMPVNCNLSQPTRCTMPSVTAGTLEVMNQPGPLTDVWLYAGGLVLHGHDGPEEGEIAGVPALRLDASREDTFTTVTAGDHTFVEEWRDADGRTAVKAMKRADATRPFRTVDSVSGQTVVDFGSAGDDATQKFGPSGCLQFSKAIDKVREIHVVFRDHFRANTMPSLVSSGDLGEWRRDWLRHYWGTLADAEGFSDTPTLAGHTMFDGQTTQAKTRPETILNLHALASSLNDHDATVAYLGLGSTGGGAWQGGACIAELIVYTNELTLAERARTHRYLMRKWRPDLRLHDFGTVSIEKADCTLEVADGTLSVRELRLPTGTRTFVKKGAGQLTVGKLSPAGVEIDVQGGGVTFAPLVEKTAAPEGPAADPTAWFDATHWETDIDAAEGSGDGKTRVGVWHDRRGRGFVNVNGDVYTLRTPKIQNVVYSNATVETGVSAARGLAMVDCGPYIADAVTDGQVPSEGTSLSFYRNDAEEKSVSQLNDTTDQRHREMFVVFLKTDAKARPIASHGSDIIEAQNNNSLAQRSYSGTRLLAGHWSLNGRWVDPETASYDGSKVQVVAFRLARPMGINAFFRDRGYTQGTGGGKLGEVIAYDRVLTPQERRDTELYLLGKWQGIEVHPEDETVACGVPRVSGLEVTLGVAAGTTADVGAVVSDSLTKVGGGSLSADVDFESVKSLRSEGGTLNLGYPAIFGARFHVDATDLASMTYTVVDGVTNVSDWAGAKAVSTFWYNNVAYYPRLPQLVTDRATTAAPEMPYMDFGRFTTREGKTADYLTANVPLSAAMEWPDFGGSLCEFYAVARDIGTEDGYAQFIGTCNEGETVCATDFYPFLRSTQPILYAEWPSKGCWNGYISMDGNKTVGGTVPNSDVHVYCFQPLNPLTHRFALAKRVSYSLGGLRIGECVAFDQANSASRRTLIETYLCNKWLGTDKPVPARAWNLESLSCANGGTLSFGEETTVRAAAAGGDGTLAFPSGGGVAGIGSLAFAFRGKTDVDALHVDGDFAVAATGTAAVALEVSAGAKISTIQGEYVLLSAKTFTDFGNFANWDFRIEGAALRHASAVFRAVEGRGLVLSIVPNGSTILIR